MHFEAIRKIARAYGEQFAWSPVIRYNEVSL